MTPGRFALLRAVLDRRQPDLTVVLEAMRKPHNFSAIMRTADAVGVLEAHTVRASEKVRVGCSISGGISKWVRARAHASLTELLAELGGCGFAIVAAHPGPGAVDYREMDFTRPTALVLGTERFGVSDATLEVADQRLTIPMHGMGRSLNVSVAAALVLYEARRQREQAGFYDAPRLDPERYRRTLFEWAHPGVAAECRERGLPYPPLDEDGRITEPLPPPPAPEHAS